MPGPEQKIYKLVDEFEELTGEAHNLVTNDSSLDEEGVKRMFIIGLAAAFATHALCIEAQRNGYFKGIVFEAPEEWKELFGEAD